MTESTNYIEQARTFLTRNSFRLALQAVPMALITVAAAHAAGFNAPSSTSATACSSGGGVTSYSLTGAAKNSGAALTLSGNAAFTVNGVCTFTLVWKGTGTGTFSGPSATIGANFSITPPATGFIEGYGLTLLVNGAQQYNNVCAEVATFRTASRSLTPRSTFGNASCTSLSLSPTAINGTSAALSTWEVDVTIVAISDGADTVGISVPASSSIDITGASATAVPVLSSAALALTALLLLGLAAFQLVGWKPAGGGFPGRPF